MRCSEFLASSLVRFCVLVVAVSWAFACAPSEQEATPTHQEPTVATEESQEVLRRVQTPEREPSRRPDIVLITIDTLRADRLGIYGADVATPNIDRLARSGAVFDQAACPMTITRPSHFSLFTSRYPRDHGVVNNQLALPESETTMAEVLAEEGYRTGAFVGVRILGQYSGAKQGFETLVEPESVQSPADLVVAQAIDWLATIDPEEPVFLWVHLYDPHMPYAPPKPFRPDAAPDVPELLTEEASWGRLSDVAVARGGELGSAAFLHTKALYDGEVSWTDSQIGALFEGLERNDRWDGSLIAFTADHGECFENGYFFRHADCMSDGAIRVPLILHYENQIAAGQRIETPVELLDVAPTIISLAGIARPESFSGRDLTRAEPPVEYELILGNERFAFIEYPLYSELSGMRRQDLWRRIQRVQGARMRRTRADLRIAGVRTDRFKYLAASDGREMLYDLVADPGERKNVVENHPEEADRLRRLVRRILREHPLTVIDEGQIDPRLLGDLKALGYL